jgi:hypothetical protein
MPLNSFAYFLDCILCLYIIYGPPPGVRMVPARCTSFKGPRRRRPPAQSTNQWGAAWISGVRRVTVGCGVSQWGAAWLRRGAAWLS